jgi:hypothetical protein
MFNSVGQTVEARSTAIVGEGEYSVIIVLALTIY